MVELKSDAAVDAMREAGRVVANALAAVRDRAAVGTSLLELDEVAHGVLRAAGARSPFLNYRPSFAPTPFPAVICASVNDVIVHGIPDGYRLRDGDLVSIDFGAELDGWTGDAAKASRSAPLMRPTWCSSKRPKRRSPPGWRRLWPGTGSATSPRLSARYATRPGMASRPALAGTASAAGCTRIRMSPTTGGRAVVCACAPAWCWLSSLW